MKVIPGFALSVLLVVCNRPRGGDPQPSASESVSWPAATAPASATGQPDDIIDRRPVPVHIVPPEGSPSFRIMDGYIVTDRRGKSAAVLQMVLTKPVQPEQHAAVDALMQSAIKQMASALHMDSGDPPEIHVYVYDSEDRARKSTFDALAWCGFEPEEYNETECINHIPMTFADRVAGAVAKLRLPDGGPPEVKVDAMHHGLWVTARYLRAPTFVSAVEDCLDRSLTLYQQLRDLTALTYVASWGDQPVLRISFAGREQLDGLDFPRLRALVRDAGDSVTARARPIYEHALTTLPKGSVAVSARLQ
jgi:hypothetical protein